MTERSPDEELDNARAAEAARRWAESFEDAGRRTTAALAAKLAKRDLERAREAYRLFGTANGPEAVDGLAVAAYAARLGREGWDPEDDMLLKEARRVVVERLSHVSEHAKILSGGADHSPILQVVYACLRRGMELAKEQS